MRVFRPRASKSNYHNHRFPNRIQEAHSSHLALLGRGTVHKVRDMPRVCEDLGVTSWAYRSGRGAPHWLWGDNAAERLSAVHEGDRRSRDYGGWGGRAPWAIIV